MYPTFPSEVFVVLALLSPSFALSIPVTAVLDEPVRQTATATVAVSNPATGAAFRVGVDELTVNAREAKGSGDVTFDADPAGSVRTWAVYFLDEDGGVLGEPEIVDVSFDDAGNGTVAAREGGAPRVAYIKVDDHIVWTRGYDQRHLRVGVQGAGADAAFVGIQELRVVTSVVGSPSGTIIVNGDLQIVNARVYAAFQGLALDTIVAIDSWKTTMEGSVDVSGVGVSSRGEVEGGAELRWDLVISDTTAGPCNARVCDRVPVVIDEVSYLEAVGAVKRKTGAPPAVKLQPVDVLRESWDVPLQFSLDGDARGLETAASMVLSTGEASDVVSLDPGSFTTRLAAELDYSGGRYDFLHVIGGVPQWGMVALETFDLTVADSAGGIVSTHICAVEPTAKTVLGTSRRTTFIGECTRDEAGIEVSRLRMRLDEDGQLEVDIELAGAALTREGTVCPRGGECGSVNVLDGVVTLSHAGDVLVEGAMDVLATRWDLPFTFNVDLDGAEAEVAIEVVPPVGVTWRWVDADGLVGTYERGEPAYTVDLDDLALDYTGQNNMRVIRANEAWYAVVRQPAVWFYPGSLNLRVR